MSLKPILLQQESCCTDALRSAIKPGSGPGLSKLHNLRYLNGSHNKSIKLIDGSSCQVTISCNAAFWTKQALQLMQVWDFACETPCAVCTEGTSPHRQVMLSESATDTSHRQPSFKLHAVADLASTFPRSRADQRYGKTTQYVDVWSGPSGRRSSLLESPCSWNAGVQQRGAKPRAWLAEIKTPRRHYMLRSRQGRKCAPLALRV